MKTRFVAAGLAAVLAGCGGDDDGGSLDCSEFSACGGDPVGEWSIIDACFDDLPMPELDNCPEATASVEDVVVTGSVNVRDDGSYSSMTESSATIVIHVPMDCLQGASCADLAQAAGVPCSDDGDSCKCQDDTEDRSQETGSWERDGSTLTLTDSEGNVDEADFCVQGDVLKAQSQEDPDSPLITFVMTR
jgi:hypothetical protein